MLVAESRPRTLGWTHAGPLLFGDWGTSRLYVLGLAFYYTGHASVAYLAAISVIMAAVAWGYVVVCRCFPDGGGVYSAARRLSPLLSVVAATLLFCGFIITASLSAVEAFHYFGVHSPAVIIAASIGTMVVLGVINWLGAKAAGRVALIIAVAAVITSAVIGALCIPLLPAGMATATWTAPGVENAWDRWESLVRIVLALSGVEAVASMTGLMKRPVDRTAKKTIWPVLLEVVALNMIFGIALNALPGRYETTVPDYVVYERGGADGALPAYDSDLTPPKDASPAQREAMREVKEYRSTAVKVLADHAGTRALGPAAGNALGIGSGIVLGLLLLSAVNTAILAMVSVLYSLARDRELPPALGRLNYSGVPWLGLIVATAAPAAVLLFVHDDKALGELYAIGVVGAIAINMVCCAINRGLPIKRWERSGLWLIGGFMSVVFATIIVAKPHATLFAGSIIAAVLAVRFVVRRGTAAAAKDALPAPAQGWMAELRQDGFPKLDPTMPRIMLAARGRDNAQWAVDLAKRRGAALFAIYVRTLRVLDITPGQTPSIEGDPEAQEALGTVALLAKQAGVPFFPIYVTSPSVADEILDYTVTFGCDTLIMGKSKRSLFTRRVTGDVLSEVSEHLPDGVSLVTRAGEASVQPPAE
ncbi:MAG TPA: universal stress protein [Phycisphaerales bacterium]|nr:universal stress protein [Phycisphaerales bacterium]